MDIDWKNSTKKIMLIVLLLTYVAILFRTAWLSDDAFITLRTALNHLNGWGPRFNIDERVQGYTHPAWYLAIYCITLITNNVFVTTYLLSFACSFAAAVILIRALTANLTQALLFLPILILSKAFVDFSTSGLENPLAHLLIAITCWLGLKAKSENQTGALTAFALSFVILYLVRPDLLILLAPFFIHILAISPATRRIKCIILITSLTPLIIWLLFSISYYGFPFPNTAYAKLGTGIPLVTRTSMGLDYFEESLRHDPITLSTLAFCIPLGLIGQTQHRANSFGILCYLLYIVLIGGDFMSGRFFTAPLLLAVINLSSIPTLRLHVAFITLAIPLGISNIQHTLLSGADFRNTSVWHGIADERGVWYPRNGL
ncbi:MAG TPA: hypothetical protein VFM46_01000, partial [Pseudomonadales bacterium]|nr:hypothetical protein [Pseudomonadales bacterium]